MISSLGANFCNIPKQVHVHLIFVISYFGIYTNINTCIRTMISNPLFCIRDNRVSDYPKYFSQKSIQLQSVKIQTRECHSQGSVTDQGVHDVLVSQESLRLDVRKLQGGVILHGFLVFIDIHQALNHFQRTLHPHGHLNVKWIFFLWRVERMIGN